MSTLHVARPRFRGIASAIRFLPVVAVLISFGTCHLHGQDGRPLPVRGRNGMVASAHAIASQVGVDILRQGGNAVDAAVAVGFTLAVTYPRAGNLGGGGFMLVRMADGTCSVIDYRETAPAAARRAMYLDANGNLIPRANEVGDGAAGVPGTVAGFALALELFGTMAWSDLLEPAHVLASKGYSVSYAMAKELRDSASLLMPFPESRRIFLRNGLFYSEGDTFRQPDLAATLGRLQIDGPREFYEGTTARLIIEDMELGGGLITADDLRAYRAVVREPLRGSYRGHEILAIPPPSSGGIGLIEMLNILERFDMHKSAHNAASRYHLLIETMKHAYGDRARYLGDPDFINIPVNGLISKEYARKIAGQINIHSASRPDSLNHDNPSSYEHDQTTHYTIVDRWGNIVTNTYTINGWYGCGNVIRGTGFLMNNEMDDFTAKPGEPNQFGLIQGEGNTIAPGKRPLSSMAPTIILNEGKPWFAIGSPGGSRIITTVLQVILNIIDHGMNLQQAIDAPRLHHQWMPDVVRYEPFGFSPETIESLRAMGHRLEPWGEVNPYQGDVEGIMIDLFSGMRLGGFDPRSPDAAATGY